MKNINKYINTTSRLLIGLFTMVILSCEEENPIESKTTFFAEFSIDNKTDLVWELNTPYIEPEVKAIENGTDLPVEVLGIDKIDITKVGIYTVTYRAKNSDGFLATITRNVVVHDPSVIGNNVSGNIQDKNTNTRKGSISLVKGTNSIFFVTDFAFGGVFPMYFQMNGDIISEIPQVYPLGQSSVDLTYDPTNGQFTTKVNPAGYSYAFEYEQ